MKLLTVHIIAILALLKAAQAIETYDKYQVCED